MEVCNASTASPAIVWVVGNGEEADTLVYLALGLDLLVEVMDYRNVHGSAAGRDPVFTELVPVAVVNGLDGVAKFVQDPHEGLEIPPCAA